MKPNLIKTTVYTLLFLLLTATIVYNQNTPVKSSNKGLKVISFNIRYGTAEDGDNSWENRKQILFDLLMKEKADVIGLQEALRSQLDEIKSIFPFYAELGVGREDGKTEGEYSAILFLKNKFVIEDTGYFWFSDKPDEPGSKTWGNNVTRICTWVLLKDKAAKNDFYFYNLHLDHESQNSREKSVDQLLRHIQGKKYPVIITGDFNAGEDNTAIKNILSAGLTDSFRKLHPDEKEVNTYHAFKGTVEGDKIDFIFCSKEIKIYKSEILRTNKEGKYPSDHFPINAVVGF
jgi:endonuclease/exonuclease/phosphatase family metal-dependent hydrolase